VDEPIDQLVWESSPKMRDPAVPPETTMILYEALRKLRALDPRGATILSLRIDGWTFQQIAEELRMPVASAHRQLALARAWLREYLLGNPRGKGK
jgi:DNA-directed RNA polymerase specialized sigma24 family protein